MHNKMYRWMMVIAACTCCVRQSVADDEQLGLAASDPLQVSAIVAQKKAAEVPAFAGQVMQAIAKMPLSPKLRLQQMQDVSAEFLKASPQDELSPLLAQMVMNVPFQMLPGWVDAFKPSVDERTALIVDDAHDKLASGVLKQIEAADGLSDEDKTIYATFAIVLLARGKSPEELDAFVKRMLDVLPAGYRDQVAAAAPAALNGDYSLLLGPGASGERLVKPSGGTLGQSEILTSPNSFGETIKQPNLLVYDVNRPFPLPRATEGGATVGGTSTPAPVVPPPYVGQF